MKKKLILLLLSMMFLESRAQQNIQYTQFMLNDYGLNPAVAGSSKGWMFLFGRRAQWQGFALAPETNFATVTKDFGKKGYRRYWHGVGASIEQDKSGAFSSKSASLSYAVHLKLSPKYHVSLGLAAGVKNVSVSNSIYDAADPVLSNRVYSVVLPDITPGLYLYSKKIIAGVAVRNLYQSKLDQGKKEIGGNSRLYPNFYISAGRKFVSGGYDFIFVPAVHVQTTFVNVPVVNFNCMTYFRKRVGFGLSYRMHDALAGILQVRLFSNVVVGISYDYTISRFASAKANSTEFMFGFSPIMSTENYDRPSGAANCPRFEL
jgi:type IX secretion system PorP/SprF family membrane protein